jgi:predicted phosphohydrolase
MCAERPDVLVVAGDVFALEPELLTRCLRLFEAFEGPKLLVAGNHDLWTRDGGDSFALYETVIPERAAACGFHDLDAAPLIVGDVGFVGTIGWYDYSFRDRSLGIPLRFYAHKAAPGYCRRRRELRGLLDPDEELPAKALAARSYWNDGRMIHWDLDDGRFNALTIERLAAQLREVEGRVRAVVAVTHHIPFAEMLVRKSDPSWGFGNAFMGSAGLGETLLACPKVTHAVFGHSHTRGRQTIGHIDAVNVGCTYRMKRYDLLEV